MERSFILMSTELKEKVFTSFDKTRLAELTDRLNDIERSQEFTGQAKSLELLEYLVSEELEGRGEEISGYSIASDVFHRGDEFDPAESSLVRVQMYRLRRLLDKYNGNHPETPQIRFAARSYRPEFDFGEAYVSDPVPTASPSDEEPVFGGVISKRHAHSGNVNRAFGSGGNIGDEGTEIRGNRVWQFAARRGTAIAIALVVVTAIVILLYGVSDFFGGRQIERLAPRTMIAISADDPDVNALTRVRDDLVYSMQNEPLPVAFQAGGDVDYTIELKSSPLKDGASMVTMTAYRFDGAMIITKAYVVEDITDPKVIDDLTLALYEQFTWIDGAIPNDVRYSGKFDPQRAEILGCYIDLMSIAVGHVSDSPDAQRILDCLQPELITDPKERSEIYAERASLMNISIAGNVRLDRTYTTAEVLKELDKAEETYGDPNSRLNEKIQAHWRDPQRTAASLRALLASIENKPVTREQMYFIAASYTHFLDEQNKAEPYVNRLISLLEVDDTNRDTIYYFVALPGLLLDEEYDEALKYLEKTGATEHDIYQLYDLVLHCKKNSPKHVIDKKGIKLRSTLAKREQSITEFIVERKYSTRLQEGLMSAFATPQCVQHVI